MKNTKTIAATLIILVLLAGAWMWTKSMPAGRATQLQVRASEYMVQRNFPRAIEEYKKSLQFQYNPDTKLGLGVALARAGRRDEAMQVLEELAQDQNEVRVSKTAKKMLAKMERDPQWLLPKRKGN